MTKCLIEAPNSIQDSGEFVALLRINSSLKSSKIVQVISRKNFTKCIKKGFQYRQLVENMSNVPEDLKYTKEHQWVRVDGDFAIVGITDHAQNELANIVYAEVPKIGSIVRKGDVLGAVESVKTVAEVYSPVSGEVVKSNVQLEESPQLINESPYSKGWIAVIKISDPSELSDLLDAGGYRKSIGE
jgi:glycine cleavage system H protein